MDYSKLRRVPNHLRKYRRARGLKQHQVAKFLGLKGTSRICRWERGTCIPSTVNMLKLALIYGVMAEALFFDLRQVLKQELRAKWEVVSGEAKHK